MANRQDKEYSIHRKNELDPIREYEAGFGRSVNALFEVNKEFSSLAARFIFEVRAKSIA